jgi:hypothetical protein
LIIGIEKMENKEIPARNYNNLFEKIAEILTEAGTKVVQEINKAQVLAYWEIGRKIRRTQSILSKAFRTRDD